MQSFGQNLRVVVVGSSGGIGSALTEYLVGQETIETIYATSRSPAPASDPKVIPIGMDITQEQSVMAAAQQCKEGGKLDLILVASGLLHDGSDFQPEKTWQKFDPVNAARAFATNSIGPALVAKHFIPLLARNKRNAFAAISARVGSISDNRLGGWYSYRASKAALNMLIKCLAIEQERKNKQSVILALHPGTVNTHLSKPFQANVPEGGLFDARNAAEQLLQVVDNANPTQSGSLLAFDGSVIAP